MISALTPETVSHQTVSNRHIEVRKASMLDIPPPAGRLRRPAFYSPTVGEVRSLAVAESHKTHGIGRLIVESLVYEAKMYGLDAVFAFTYVPGFFAKVSFYEAERGELPLKAWKDCLRCAKFNNCDEVAVLRVLRPQRWEQRQAVPPVLGIEQGMVMILPTVRR